LNTKQKLDIIIYNKQLQEKIEVNIEDYKKISGKYKIAQRTGKGVEFILNTNKLIFEGEYLNGKRNEKGKEYYKNSKLGKRNGKGKEYRYFRQLKFEGKYLNGKKSGKGKEYNQNKQIKFEGEYLYGLRNGKGKQY
jgi:antitoxin component YwqK of YwqJK toxin-antitoxin module